MYKSIAAITSLAVILSFRIAEFRRKQGAERQARRRSITTRARINRKPRATRSPSSLRPRRERRRQSADLKKGVTRLSLFHIRPDIKAGRLVPMLEAYNPGDVEEVNVVYVGHGGRLPARVRALIDFLAEEVDFDDALELLDTI